MARWIGNGRARWIVVLVMLLSGPPSFVCTPLSLFSFAGGRTGAPPPPSESRTLSFLSSQGSGWGTNARIEACAGKQHKCGEAFGHQRAVEDLMMGELSHLFIEG
uniref:Uncharacterized protein n=1 Tax=Setaria italica TaxID=4555 RepID=K3Y091_SETIT